MKGLMYLYKRTIANRVKKALKRPRTYAVAVVIAFYAVLVFYGFLIMAKEANMQKPENFVTILAMLVLFVIPSNVISYARRKGLLFQPAQTHFVFPAPVNPKLVLMFAAMRNFLINLVLGIIIVIAGVWMFHISLLKMLIYFLFFVVFETILEASIVIFCYGNEKLHERFFKGLTVVMYIFMAIMVGVGAFLLLTREASFAVIQEYLAMPVIQLIPIVGWNIAVIHLIIMGADVVNIVGTILFLISTVVMFVLANRMKCTGEYYEDAAKFADMYKEIKEKQKRGEVSVGFGKKKKYKEASVEYKGNYAKAIYFRQMLEYKKSKTFIFGWNTLVCLGIGILIAAYGIVNDIDAEFGQWKVFAIPAVMAYLIFILSGYATKWSKELENPYTYLIPDSPLKKVWYSTKIEHIRAIVDGILLTVPGAVVWGINPALTILTVLLYICLKANLLYYGMLADVIIGKSLGSTGRTLVKMLLQGIAMTAGIIAAVIGYFAFGMEAAFSMMILVVGLLTFAGAVGASVSFTKMEVLD